MRKRYWVSTSLVAVALLGLTVAGFSAAYVIQWRIERRYPGVKIASVTFSRSGFELHNVTIDRPNLKAHLLTVRSKDGSSVTVEGGTVEITSGGSTKETATSLPDIHGNLDRLKATRAGITVEAVGVTFDREHVCVEHLDGAKTDLPPVHADTVCGLRDGSDITAKSIRVPVKGWQGITPFEKYGSYLQGGLPVEAVLEEVHARPKERRLTVKGVVAGSIKAEGVEATLDAETSASIHLLQFEVPRIYKGPLRFEDLHVKGSAPWNIVHAQVKGVHLLIRPRDMAIEGDEDCNTWIDAMPEALKIGPLQGQDWAGRLLFALQVKPEPKLTLKGTCRVACSAFADLRKKFTYTAYDAKGEEFERVTGPKTKEWVNLASMSPALPVSVIALEDPGFRSHRGVIAQALENSLRDDVKLSRFARGGSTITMQLAKNIFLRRDKTLARKSQEIFIAMGLESCFSKDEILETYLNVVEFGPDIYGVKAAADTRFDTEPLTLAPDEALYLASILPSPKKAPPYDDKAKARIQTLAKRLSESGRLPEDMVVVDDLEWE